MSEDIFTADTVNLPTSSWPYNMELIDVALISSALRFGQWDEKLVHATETIRQSPVPQGKPSPRSQLIGSLRSL